MEPTMTEKRKAGGAFTFSENHPILMGWWERDKEGRRVHWNIDNYFGRSVRTNRWQTRDGDILETTSRLWIIQDYFDALVSTGFVVERLVEPEPIEEDRQLNRERYERAKRIPYFILFKASKRF